MKHGERMEKGDKEGMRANKINVVQEHVEFSPSGHLLRNCVEHALTCPFTVAEFLFT